MKTFVLSLLALGLLAGCSSNSNPPASQPAAASSSASAKPATQATETKLGRAAFQDTYIAARGWARDAQPFMEQSQPTKEVNGADGKAAVWSAGFGSQMRSAAKTFTWSGTDAADAPSRGVNPGSEDSFSPSNSSQHTFDLAYLKIDSDKAFEVSQAHGGKKLSQKDASMPVFYRLSWDGRENALVWHVMYGSDSGGKLSVVVNASTGQFIRVEK